MGAFTQLADPANCVTYWVFTVSGDNAKGGKERPVRVTSLLMDALIAYRLSFALPPILPTEIRRPCCCRPA
jgi:hypothetical protein